jgi:carboxypeptidase Taq
MGKIEELKSYVAEIVDIQHVVGLLEWDQSTYMPPGGSPARAEQTTTLQKIAHARTVAPEAGELLQAAEGEAAGHPYDSDEAAMVRQVRRFYDHAVKIPADLVARMARANALAFDKWVEARSRSDFSLFSPHLEEIVALQIEQAQALGYQEHPYDALLDLYEPEMKTRQVREIFARLREGLVPIVHAILGASKQPRTDFLEQAYDVAKQETFSLDLLKGIGYDFQRGRQDKVAHPFTQSFSIGDVRVTNRFLPEMPASSIFSAIHEGGHALYDQGVEPRFERTALENGASTAIHESQSRMWENAVGRSLSFWTYWYPRYQALFPEYLKGISLEQFWQAINAVRASAIRVEADEVTYNLHVLLRFEIETGLIEGSLKVKDLPEIWNTRMMEYIGYQPKNDAEGVLQDVHWSLGYFGYFPTYALGTILSLQFFNVAKRDLPDLDEQFAAGDTSSLFGWLKERIWQYGSKYTPVELIQRVAGGPIDPDPFLRYLREKYGALYGI